MAAHFICGSYGFMVSIVLKSKNGEKLPEYSGYASICQDDD